MAKKGIVRAKSLFFFPTTFVAVALSAVTYRNYINPLDFALSGAFSAAIWRTMLGPKAQAAAALGGGAFGLVFGCFVWVIFKVGGVEIPEYR